MQFILYMQILVIYFFHEGPDLVKLLEVVLSKTTLILKCPREDAEKFSVWITSLNQYFYYQQFWFVEVKEADNFSVQILSILSDDPL